MSKKSDFTEEERFEMFWSFYHHTTKKPKTDKKAAWKKWRQLNLTDQREAYLGVKSYFLWAIEEYGKPQFVKKARTYLEDRVWEDEREPEYDPRKTYVK